MTIVGGVDTYRQGNGDREASPLSEDGPLGGALGASKDKQLPTESLAVPAPTRVAQTQWRGRRISLV